MKKKYNKPLTYNTTVRNEMNFCGSIFDNEAKTVTITSEAQDYESFDASDAFVKDSNGDIAWE